MHKDGRLKRSARVLTTGKVLLCVVGALAACAAQAEAASDPQAPISLASVLDLEGGSRELGWGMREGIEAALHGVRVGGRPVKLHFFNDSYTPSLTVEQTRAALRLDIVAMVGNTGTPTAAVALPLLQDLGIPAIGFFTGADLLRTSLSDGVFNLRASYDQEIEHLVSRAVANGLAADEICAMAQNDAFGEAGLRGLSAALEATSGGGPQAAAVRETLAIVGHSASRNGYGPVGYFERESPTVYHGYRALKDWESKGQVRCRLVLVIGTYASIARFQAYSRLKIEDWLIAALSFTGAEALGPVIRAGPPDDRIIMTQVVPPLDSELPIVVDARFALGRDLGFVSLEGYMVGRLVRAALESAGEAVTPERFAAALRGKTLDVGGATFDFSNDNQGLDRVYLTYLSDSGWRSLPDEQWRRWFPPGRMGWLTRWFK